MTKGMEPNRFEHIMDFLEIGELTEWEQDFVDNIRGWWDEKGFLTEKQADKLEDIYKKGTDND